MPEYIRVLLEPTKNNDNILKVNFFMPSYTVQYIDAELQRRLPNKVAVLLKVDVICSERKSPCIQGTNNTAKGLKFSDNDITRLIYNGPNSQQAKYSGIVSILKWI